jgi:hypothetical protein
MATAMHARFAVLATFFLLSAPAVHAASGLVLPDLPAAFTILGDLEADQKREDASRAFEESSELFPEVSVESDSTIDDQRDERTAEFLTIRVGAKEIVLRDVPLKEWFAPYVRVLAELQLVSGYRDADGNPTGTYGPADPVTLEQVAKVAVLAAGIDATSCRVPPLNLSASGAWSAQYVGCAEQREWAVFADPTADLKRPATREEVVMTILQAFKRELDVETASLTFTDVEKTSAYAPAIAKAAVDGVVSGYTDGEGNLTGTFGPKNNVTRAEFAKIVSVSLQLYGK